MFIAGRCASRSRWATNIDKQLLYLDMAWATDNQVIMVW